MSTKTLTKRLALATSVALGAGVLSLVSVTSAHAAVGAAAVGLADNATNGVTAVLASAADGTAAKSTGVLTTHVTAATGNTKAVALSTSVLSVYGDAGYTGTYSGFSVTGGTISGVWNANVNAAGTFALSTAAAQGVGILVKPASGATSVVISYYDGLSSTATSTSSGTYDGSITVTVASSSVAGVVSPSLSGIFYSAVGAETAGAAALTTDDATNKIASHYLQGSTPWNQTQNAIIQLADAYGNAIAGGTSHLVTATATNGAKVGVVNTGTATGATVGSAFSAAASAGTGTWSLGVADPSAAPLSTTVTIAYDGVTVGTKTFTFTGPVTKVTLGAPLLINATGKSTTASKGLAVSAFDSAGNSVKLYGTDAIYKQSVLTAVSANPATTAISVSSAVSDGTATYADWTCQAGIAAHSDSVSMRYTNIDGSVATSNAVSVSCSGAPDKYKASFDKDSYNPGDVAVLTVTFLDSKGNVAADNGTDGTLNTPFSGYTTTNPQISVSGGSLAANVTTADTTTLGKGVYRVLTGSTSGTFQTVVNVTAGSPGADGTAQTAALVIGSSGTSLNDVLKGIVSLIASINKQIAALAKLVTKK